MERRTAPHIAVARGPGITAGSARLPGQARYERAQLPDTGDGASDLRHIANTVVHLQTRTAARPAFLGLIAEAQVNPGTRAAFLAEFAERRRELTRAVLKRAIQRRQIRAGADIDLFIDALGGAVTFRLLQGHAPLTTTFTNGLIKLLPGGCSTKESR